MNEDKVVIVGIAGYIEALEAAIKAHGINTSLVLVTADLSQEAMNKALLREKAYSHFIFVIEPPLSLAYVINLFHALRSAQPKNAQSRFVVMTSNMELISKKGYFKMHGFEGCYKTTDTSEADVAFILRKLQLLEF